MLPLMNAKPRSILFIGAHCDDIEIGCYGTVRTLIERDPDIEIAWIVLSGEEERAKEARAAAAEATRGCRNASVEVLDFPDTLFAYEAAREIKAFFSDLAGRARPDFVFTHRRSDRHQDHSFVGELTWQHFRDHAIFEYEIPKYEGDLGQPNVFVPVRETFAREKIETVVETFATQREKPWFSRETLNSLMRLRGIESRAPSGWAEAFHCAKLVLM